MLKHANSYEDEERQYPTLGSAQWMEETKAQLPPGTWVNPVLWSSDKTNVTLTRNAYPVYQLSGALSVDRRYVTVPKR